MRQLRTSAARLRLFVVVAAISAITLAASSPIYPAVSGGQVTGPITASSVVAAGGAAARADCSEATARQLVEEHKLNVFLLPNPVAQVLCGPFTGPGSEAMAITITAPTCWAIQNWAVLSFTGGVWRLVLRQPAYLIPPLVAVGSDIRETTAVFRPGDPRCIPTGGSHARVWQWDGARLVAGPWKQVTKGKTEPRKPAVFRSLSGNIRCSMFDWGGSDRPGVNCSSLRSPQRVRMDADGRLKICRGTRCIDSGSVCGCDEASLFPRVGYGRTITFQPFRCTSLRSGVRCTVIRTGKGFLINRAGVRRVGP